MSAVAFVAAQGERTGISTAGWGSYSMIGISTIPRNNQYLLVGIWTDNDASDTISSMIYRTALEDIPMTDHVRYVQGTDRVLHFWGCPLRWWQTDERGVAIQTWSNPASSRQICWMTLVNVRPSDPIYATATHPGFGTDTIGMVTDGMVVSLMKVYGGAQNYNPANEGVERWDSISEGDNMTFGLSTDAVGVPTNTYGWTHTGTARSNFGVTVSLNPEAGKEVKEIRSMRRGRHGLMVPTGYPL